MYLVYVLKSLSTSHYYTGQTNDVNARLILHNSGKVKYTSRFGPWKIIYLEEYDSRNEAVLREKYLKSHAGRSWLKKNAGMV